MPTTSEKRDREKADAVRCIVLKRAWDALQGDISRSVPVKYLAKLTKLDETDIRAAVAYWNSKRTTRWATLAQLQFFVTESGVEVAESLDAEEEKPAFAHVTTNHYNFDGPVGAVQTGPNSIANIVQHAGAPSELLTLLREIRARVESGETDDRELAIATTASIERELLVPTPDRSKLVKLGGALQTVVTGTAAALLTAWLKNLIGF